MTDTPIHRFAAAPMDRPTLLLSAAFCAALLGLALTVPAAEGGTAGILLGVVAPAVIVVLAYGFSPDAYDLTAEGRLRVVRRLFGSRTFTIDKAAVLQEPFGLGGIRLAGSGGAFGWYGVFWRKGTGRYRAYVTDRSGTLVACTGPEGLVVISPLDATAFVAAAPNAPTPAAPSAA